MSIKFPGGVILATLVLCLSAVQISAVAAQSDTSVRAHETPERTLSFQPRPQPEAKTFFITEAGMLFSSEVLGLKDRAWGPNYELFWDLGLMTNLSRQYAVGGSLGFTQGNNTEEFSIALKPRFRYWISRRVPLDISVGIPIANNAPGYTPTPRFLADATVMYYDWAGITARVLTTHVEYPINLPAEPFQTVSFNKTEFYAGLRVGSYPGLIGGGAVAIAIAVITAIFPED